jgi:hypothetical protein
MLCSAAGPAAHTRLLRVAVRDVRPSEGEVVRSSQVGARTCHDEGATQCIGRSPRG